jgi:hypothetical protein
MGERELAATAFRIAAPSVKEQTGWVPREHCQQGCSFRIIVVIEIQVTGSDLVNAFSSTHLEIPCSVDAKSGAINLGTPNLKGLGLNIAAANGVYRLKQNC